MSGSVSDGNPLAEDLEHVLAHTGGLWDSLRGGRIFITGGSGFFGFWLLETLVCACNRLELDTRAVVLTRSPALFQRKLPRLAQHRAVELVEGDVRNFRFPDGKFTHVIHAAIEYAPPLRLFDNAIAGTRRTLEFAAAAGAVKYLLASSGAVYGSQPPELARIPETFAGAPDPTTGSSAYGEAKRVSEFLCTAYSETAPLETMIARGFAFVGPYLPLHLGSAIGNFVGDALKGRPIKITGDGTPVRSYLYGADLAIWLWTILFLGKPCRAYNVGSDEELSIADVAQIVLDEVNPSGTIHVSQQPVEGLLPHRYVPSVDRARNELGLDPLIDVREGVRRMAHWYKKQPPQ